MRVLTYPYASGDSSKDVAQARKGRSVALLPALPLGLWGPQLPGWEAGCGGGGGGCSPGLMCWDRGTIASGAAGDSLRLGHKVCTSLASASDAHLGPALDQSEDSANLLLQFLS